MIRPNSGLGDAGCGLVPRDSQKENLARFAECNNG